MMKTLDATNQFFIREKAEVVAKQLNAGDDDWTYVVKHDLTGKGYSFMEIYDEDGLFVSKL